MSSRRLTTAPASGPMSRDTLLDLSRRQRALTAAMHIAPPGAKSVTSIGTRRESRRAANPRARVVARDRAIVIALLALGFGCLYIVTY